MSSSTKSAQRARNPRRTHLEVATRSSSVGTPTGSGTPPTNAGSVHCESVRLSDINSADERFQLRLSYSSTDLRESLRTNGQLTPVQLWGQHAPYTVIDGFRRVDAARHLGWEQVRATLHPDMGEHQAFCLAFLENAKRKGLSTWDRASAVWQACTLRSMSKEAVSHELALSVRQVERYLDLMAFPEVILNAVRESKISPAHAAILKRFGPTDPAAWVARTISERLSASELRKRLAHGRRAKPRRFMAKAGDGFRMYSFTFQTDCPELERARLEQALRQALSIVTGRRTG